MISGPTTPPENTVDQDEVAQFSAMADAWWDQNGPFRPLHKFNPVRLRFIRDRICAHFDRNPTAAQPLEGLALLDIGCGGGLLSEPVCRLGARVTGADASAQNIGCAKTHAARQKLDIDYRNTTTELLITEQARFDVILNMEVIEHVANADAFIAQCATLLAPGGLMILATLNRTAKAYALAVFGAEYVLRWLPKGTHDWNKFLSPQELTGMLAKAGLTLSGQTGVSYNPLLDRWRLSRDLDVNYMLTATKPKQAPTRPSGP